MLRTSTLITALALAPLAHADILTLAAVRDATLFSDPAGAIANGSGPVLVVGRAGGAATAPIRRALVRFDVAAALPPGSQINSAQLVLVNSGGNAGARTVEVRRVLADWGEGASNTTSGQGAPAQAGDATWLNTFFPSALWSTPGGDFDSTLSTALVLDSFATYVWPSTPRTVADVQDWLAAPASNFGWLLKLDIETVSNTTKVFDSREAASSASWPSLVIDFTPPAVQPYCSARVSSVGCTPHIGWSGQPSASAGSGFTIDLAQAVNQKSGLLIYGVNGPAAQPVLGGLVCVAPPLVRTPAQLSGGSPTGVDCTGAFALDFNAHIASGVDPALVAGVVVHAQWLSRDPGNPAGSFNSSAALRVVIGP